MVATTRGISISAADRAELTEKFASMPPHPEVPDALRKLRDAGFRLFTLTDNTAEISGRQLKRAGLLDVFERRFSVDDEVRRHKPAPEAYAAVARAMQTQPSNICLEGGPADAPTLLLLHGFPTSSHMFRNLIPLLADRFHIVAPDLPGFGQSDMPSRDAFPYTFAKLAEVIGRFTEVVNLKRFAIYIFDYGAPVGLRIALKHPERITAIHLAKRQRL